MRIIRLVSISFIFAAVFAVSAYAQAGAPTKIGLVNIFKLGDKGGVTKYVNALGTINREFATEIKALQTLSTTLQTKLKSFNDLRVQAAKPNSPITQATIVTRNNELKRLQREAKFKQDDLQARINVRRQVIVGPVWLDMMKVMKTYAQQKGFAVILDGAKLEEAAIMLAFNSKSDITADFIAYYNARPAGSASTN